MHRQWLYRSCDMCGSKVRAMTRIADEGNEDYLLMIAKHGTAHHVEKLVAKYRRATRLKDAEAAKAQHDNRKLDYHYDADGCLIIRDRFPAEQGALIVKALEMAMEKQYAEAAEAATGVSAETSEESEPAPISTRRADALAEVAETYMNSEPVPNATADWHSNSVVWAKAGSEPLQDISHVGMETTSCSFCDLRQHCQAVTGPYP